MTKSIYILPHNPTWVQLFETESAAIKQALGETCVAIHHIGSTAAPGLAAKPIIDIICVIKQSSQLNHGAIEALGFEHKGEYNIPMRLYFNKRQDTQVNLHVYEEENPEIELNLMFRDYLRNNKSSLDEYAALKNKLLEDPASLQKNNSMVTGYNLGKNEFIQKILKQAGFKRLRFVRCAHSSEWDAAKHFRQTQFFDKVSIQDPYIWTFDHPDHAHFVLYKGVKIIGYAHIQLWPGNRAALRIVVIDDIKRNQSFGGAFLEFMEKWLKSQNYQSIHAESSPEALAFYKKYGYSEMSFDDPDENESYARDVPVGKKL